MTHVKVYLTKSRHFRARIVRPSTDTIEVTVGGKRWREGYGKQYQTEIFERINKLVADVNKEHNRIKESL